MAIPDFTLGTPPLLALPTTGTVANGGSFRVGRNQAFSGQVALSTVADTNDPANPMVLGTLVGSDPIDYDPNPVTPSLGAGTSVSMRGHLDERGRAGHLRRLDPGAGRQPLPDDQARAAGGQDRIGES